MSVVEQLKDSETQNKEDEGTTSTSSDSGLESMKSLIKSTKEDITEINEPSIDIDAGGDVGTSKSLTINPEAVVSKDVKTMELEEELMLLDEDCNDGKNNDKQLEAFADTVSTSTADNEMPDDDMVLKWDDDDDIDDPIIIDEPPGSQSDKIDKTECMIVSSENDHDNRMEVIENDLLKDINIDNSKTNLKHKIKLASKESIEDTVIEAEALDKILKPSDKLDKPNLKDDEIEGIDNVLQSDKISHKMDTSVNNSTVESIIADLDEILDGETDKSNVVKIDNNKANETNLQDNDCSTSNKGHLIEVPDSDNKNKDSLETDIIKVVDNISEQIESINANEKKIIDNNSAKEIIPTEGTHTVEEKQSNEHLEAVDDINMSLSEQDSFIDTIIEPIEHKLKEPNMMIEIPTQELIECDDSLELSVSDTCADSTENISKEDIATKILDNTENNECSEVTTTTENKALEKNSKGESSKLEYNNINDEQIIKGTVSELTKQSNITKDIEMEASTTEVLENITSITKSLETDIDTSNEQTSKSSETNLELPESNLKENITSIIDSLEPDSNADINSSSSSAKTSTNELKSDFKEVTSSTDTVEETESLQLDNNQTFEDSSKEAEPLPREDVPETTVKSLLEENQTIKEATVPIQTNQKPEHSDKDLPIDSLMQISKPDSSLPKSEEPSVSFNQMDPDTDGGEIPEVTDSLGLLAESSRVVEEEEEQETSEHDDGDDEEDFDPDDESSNQMTADHSEDSNAQNSESDMPKDKNVPVESDTNNTQVFEEKEAEDKESFNFAISSVVSETPEAEKDDMDVEEDMICDDVEVASDTVGEDHTDDLEPTSTTVVEPAKDTPEKEKSPPPKQSSESVPPTEIETVKLSDNSDNDDVTAEAKTTKTSVIRTILKEDGTEESAPEPPKSSPSKTKKLEISNQRHVVNIVDLEESSSEDDVQEVLKSEVTSVKLPQDIGILSSAGAGASDNAASKPSPRKPVRLNTSEVTIKTASTTEPTLVIPETKVDEEPKEQKSKPKFSLEVFTLDSDEEDTTPAKEPPAPAAPPEKSVPNKCVNTMCTSDSTVEFLPADPSTVAFYDSNKKRKAMVCQPCAQIVANRAYTLVEGVKNFTPLLDLDMGKLCQELVEISDSDSDEEGDATEKDKPTIGEEGAQFLEEKLADMLNETWIKYNMDERLQDTEKELNSQLALLEKESQEIDQMLNECQVATDKLRNDLYATFEPEKRPLTPIVIYDTPDNVFSCSESAQIFSETETKMWKKRRLSSASETPSKKPAIPLGYSPLTPAQPEESLVNAAIAVASNVKGSKPAATPTTDASKMDDDKDISVVTLSAEAAPPDLPPPGEVSRPALRAGLTVFAMRNSFGSWLKAKILECTPKGSTASAMHFSMCKVKFENKTQKTACRMLPARCLAYQEPADVRMTIGTRVIALFKDPQNTSKRDAFYSGVVAEVPNPVNNYRYLVFFDDGYAQYVRHADTRLVCEYSHLVWEEVHPFSREFVRQYLLAYPERPMVRLHTGQSLKTEWNGKWWVSRVIQVDASLVQVHFEEDDRTEWIYRGSTRLAPLYLELQAAERHRARPLPRNRLHNKGNMPYVEYTRSDETAASKSAAQTQAQAQQEEMRRQRAVAKKSTVAAHHAAPAAASAPAVTAGAPDTVTSRVVYYTPKNAVKPYKMVPHTCSPKCKRSDVLALKDLRTYNPLAKPLLSGWERQLVRFKGHKEVMYRAPCGRRVRTMRELHRYLRVTQSDMGVDLFDFAPATHCLAEFLLNKCIVGKKDLSHGKENVPVPCVNYYDESLPEFCSYNTERTPTEGVPLNLDPEFLCGCDCTDDCEDKSKCACWQLTLEGARTIGLEGNNVGYVYKRLPEPLPSGIYECNSRCKCKHTCLNRVAQHPLQLKLQVFKTLNRGWGIRALNDVPKGSFLCVYAGNLLTDATANLDGLNEGDEYLAELDYIEVVEQMKEGYEEDIPDADKKLDKKDTSNSDEDEEDEPSSEDEKKFSKDDKDDGDFQPGYIGLGVTEFNKRLRKREREKKEKNAEKNKESNEGKEKEEDCITISDDEEVREPSRFMAQAGMGANEFVSKYKSVRSYFGKDEACYIMDAKVQGNIGRYLNHSCSPNVFVQNVFVDTHDPRFPWVAFFALWHIRAGTELTWNYNYDIGSVPGKTLYCYCGAPNCRGRLL